MTSETAPPSEMLDGQSLRRGTVAAAADTPSLVEWLWENKDVARADEIRRRPGMRGAAAFWTDIGPRVIEASKAGRPAGSAFDAPPRPPRVRHGRV